MYDGMGNSVEGGEKSRLLELNNFSVRNLKVSRSTPDSNSVFRAPKINCSLKGSNDVWNLG